MSRNSPQPKVQTRAKRARIQSQRPLSPECTLITPSPLNKPLEASSVPTTSGFIPFNVLSRTYIRTFWPAFEVHFM